MCLCFLAWLPVKASVCRRIVPSAICWLGVCFCSCATRKDAFVAKPRKLETPIPSAIYLYCGLRLCFCSNCKGLRIPPHRCRFSLVTNATLDGRAAPRVQERPAIFSLQVAGLTGSGWPFGRPFVFRKTPTKHSADTRDRPCHNPS